MPRLSEAQRNQAVGMLQAGSEVTDVSRHFGCSRQTIHNLMNMFTNNGSVGDIPRPGRPCTTTLRTDRFIITLTHLRDCFLPATVTAGHYGVHAQTIINCLRQNQVPSPPSSIYRTYFNSSSPSRQTVMGTTSFVFHSQSATISTV